MKKYNKIFITFFLFLLLLLLLIQGETAATGVRRGLFISCHNVLPALFPAMVVCGMIGELSEYIPLPTAWTVWLTSHLCGFPLGIKTLTRTYRRGLLSEKQTISLSACCANASPAFLIIYVGEKLLGNIRHGVLLLFGQILISFLIGLLSGAFHLTPRPSIHEKRLMPIITDSLTDATQGGLILTGYITFFSTLAVLLQNFPYWQYLYGFIELTGGLRGGLYPAAAMIGFSGCAVILQNAVYLNDAQLPLFPLVAGKCVYAIALPLLCAIIKLF